MNLDQLTPERRREALTAYLDGELPDADARAVAAWLAVHPEGREEVERMRRLWDLLGAYPDEPVPEGFADRVIHAVGMPEPSAERAKPAGRLLRLPLLRPVAAAAVLVLALGGAAWLLRTRPSSTPAETAVALDAVPPDLLEHADVLLNLSDSEFEAALEVDPDTLDEPSQPNGTHGG